MSAYDDTSVPVERSGAGVEKLLRDRAVTDTRITRTASLIVIEFNWPLREQVNEWNGRTRKNVKVWGRKVTGILGVRIVAAWPVEAQEQRRIMRVLYWHLKSKLETVESGVVTFAEEFLPHLMVPGGRTMWDEVAPRLAAAQEAGVDLKIAMGDIAKESLALPPGR